MQEKINNFVTNKEDAVKFVQEYEEIFKNKKSDIIWLVYHQSQIFQKFKEKGRFVGMVLKFNVSNSIIVFRIPLSNLIGIE